MQVTHAPFKLFKKGYMDLVTQDQAELLLYIGGRDYIGQEETLWVSGVPSRGTDIHT